MQHTASGLRLNWLGLKGTEQELSFGVREYVALALFGAVIVALVCVGAYAAGRTVPVKADAPPLLVPSILPSSELKPAAQATAKNEVVLMDPVPPGTYLQAGVLSPAAAPAFAKGLRDKGLRVLAAPGPDEASRRILIGPLRNSAEKASVQEITENLGLPTFARTY